MDNIETGTAVALVGNIGLPAKFDGAEVSDILEKIKASVRAEGRDISTEKGRSAIRSLAYKIARTKTALDEHGKDLVAGIKKQAGVIDDERRRVRDELDALKDEIRKPLTDWEDAEKARTDAHEAALAALVESSMFGALETSSDVRARLDNLRNPTPRDWQEFAMRAETIIGNEIRRTEAILVSVLDRERQAAELARLQAQEAERKRLEAARMQQEREAQIAAEAAAKAKREAEEEAERQRVEAERKAVLERAALEEKARKERESAARLQKEAEDRASKIAETLEAERSRAHEFALESISGMISDACSPMNASEMIKHIAGMIESMSELKRDWEEFKPRFDALMSEGRQRIAARLETVLGHEKARHETARKAAEEEAERKRVAAVEHERAAVAARERAEAAETAKREADKKHRAAVNGEARDALVKAADLSQDVATAVIKALARGDVPHVKISY